MKKRNGNMLNECITLSSRQISEESGDLKILCVVYKCISGGSQFLFHNRWNNRGIPTMQKKLKQMALLSLSFPETSPLKTREDRQ